MTTPHYGLNPSGWRFVETIDVIGKKEDVFCIRGRFHIKVSRGFSDYTRWGWHLYIMPDCYHHTWSEPVPDTEWMLEVRRLFEIVEVSKWFGPFKSEVGPAYFSIHQDTREDRPGYLTKTPTRTPEFDIMVRPIQAKRRPGRPRRSRRNP